MVFVLELGFACVPGVTAPFLLVLIVSETTDSAFFRYLSSLYSSERLCCRTVTFVVLLLHLPSLFPICLFAFVLPNSCRASYHMTKRIPFSMHYASFFEKRALCFRSLSFAAPPAPRPPRTAAPARSPALLLFRRSARTAASKRFCGRLVVDPQAASQFLSCAQDLTVHTEQCILLHSASPVLPSFEFQIMHKEAFSPSHPLSSPL